MYYGIDYGRGTTNIDHGTGIRYGVISSHSVLQAWADDSEAVYGDPTCPKCGNEVEEDSCPPDDSEQPYSDYYCEFCDYSFHSEEAYGDEPLGFKFTANGYKAYQSGDNDIFVEESPYYTHAQYCSPCAPGACHLEHPVDRSGPKAYCFGVDWFDDSVFPCPYPIYRVTDGKCVYRPKG